MGKTHIILLLLVSFSLAGCSSVSASPAARIVSGVVTDVVSTIFKRLWALKSTNKIAILSRPMMKFEGGYTVETVFDGSKLGIEPHSLEVSPDGNILVLDSENSNIYKISHPLSRYSRPKLVTGSAEGYSGHVDGKLREARMNHPKGLTMDDNGNVYVADTTNVAIRKITDTGVVTIAGGKSGRGGGHVDGPSEDAMFSDDFDVVYVGSSCSLLVVDRGNQAIQEIQLHEDDCAHRDDINLHSGVAVLAAACFFGYMLALLQRRITSILSNETEPKAYVKSMSHAPYQRAPPSSVRPPLIPPHGHNEYDRQEEGLFSSLARLLAYMVTSIFEFFGGMLPSFSKRTIHHEMQHPHHHPSSRQESFVIPHEDMPPPIETREHPSRKSYSLTAKAMDKNRHLKPSRASYSGWNGYYDRQQQLQQLQHHVQHLHHEKLHPTGPQTHYEHQKNGEANEIVFGAVQEHAGRREAMVIKAVDYGNPVYSNPNVRSRSIYNSMSYAYGY